MWLCDKEGLHIFSYKQRQELPQNYTWYSTWRDKISVSQTPWEEIFKCSHILLRLFHSENIKRHFNRSFSTLKIWAEVPLPWLEQALRRFWSHESCDQAFLKLWSQIQCLVSQNLANVKPSPKLITREYCPMADSGLHWGLTQPHVTWWQIDMCGCFHDSNGTSVDILVYFKIWHTAVNNGSRYTWLFPLNQWPIFAQISHRATILHKIQFNTTFAGIAYQFHNNKSDVCVVWNDATVNDAATKRWHCPSLLRRNTAHATCRWMGRGRVGEFLLR